MKKKILFTSPNLKSGGAQRHLVNIINSLSGSEFDISLFLYSDEGELRDEIKTDIKIVSPENSLSKSLKPLYIPLGVIELMRVIKKERPSVLYSRHWCKIPNAFLGKLFSITSVSGEGNNIRQTLLKNELKMKIFYLLRKLGLKYTNFIIANSYGLASELNEVFGTNSKTEVIYNGVDISGIKEKSKEKVDHPWFKGKAPVLISVGRLSEQKGYKYLLESVKALENEIDLRLIIIGEGKLKYSLKSQAEQLSINDKVEILSPKSNPFPYIAGADVLVCPSLYEGLSNVILEALALGVPVISSDHSHGAGEIIENNRNGLLVPVADSGALAEAIKKLLTDKKTNTRIKNEARKRIRDFSIEKLGSNYKSFFNRILS